MADFAVVVVLRFLVSGSGGFKAGADELRLRFESQLAEEPRNYVLVFVVRKFDQELAFACGIAKGETRVVTRRNFRVAIRTNSRLRAFEKLDAMTTDTGIVTGKICDVGKVLNLFPVIGRDLVAGVASRLMLLRCMGKM